MLHRISHVTQTIFPPANPKHVSSTPDIFLYLDLVPSTRSSYPNTGVLLQVCIYRRLFANLSLIPKVCQAAKDVSAAQEALIDIFERIENFFKRLETYTTVRPSAGMMDIIVKIMVEVLNILGIATKEINQGRTSKLSICLSLDRLR